MFYTLSDIECLYNDLECFNDIECLYNDLECFILSMILNVSITI